MIGRADSNRDRAVSKEDYNNIMTKKNFAWSSLVKSIDVRSITNI